MVPTLRSTFPFFFFLRLLKSNQSCFKKVRAPRGNPCVCELFHPLSYFREKPIKFNVLYSFRRIAAICIFITTLPVIILRGSRKPSTQEPKFYFTCNFHAPFYNMIMFSLNTRASLREGRRRKTKSE